MRAAPEAREHLHERGRRLGEELRARTRSPRPSPAASCRCPAGRAAGCPSAPSRPSAWNDFGSRRNSTISCSSALASSTPAMSSNVTDWLEDGLICCGLMRGITFSVRHITKISATKNRIAIDRLPVDREVLDFLRRARRAAPTAARCATCARRLRHAPPCLAARVLRRGARRSARRRAVSACGAARPRASPPAELGTVVTCVAHHVHPLQQMHHPWHRLPLSRRYSAASCRALRKSSVGTPLSRAARTGEVAEQLGGERQVAHVDALVGAVDQRRATRAATGGAGGRSRRPRTRGTRPGSGASR